MDVAARFYNPSFACTDGISADSTWRSSPQVDMIGQLWLLEKHSIGASDNIQLFLWSATVTINQNTIQLKRTQLPSSRTSYISPASLALDTSAALGS